MALRVFPRTTLTLPTGGAVLREPYARGLVCAFAPGAGFSTIDLISGLTLTRTANAVVSTGGGTVGLVCGTNETAKIVCPAWLKLAAPLAIVVRLSFIGTTSNSGLFTVTANNTNTSPYVAYGLGVNASGNYRLVWSSGAAFAEFDGGATYRRAPAVGSPVTVVGNFALANTTLYFGPDEGFTLGLGANPTYSGTSELAIGQYSAGATPNVCLEYALIYNRLIVPSELKLFRDNPYHWLRPSAASQFALGAAPAAAVETAQGYVWGPL